MLDKIVSGIFSNGIGSLAKDIRTAITGKEPMTAKQQADLAAKATMLEQMSQQLESDIVNGQIDLNKIDAKSNSNFRGGWRPAIGWVCASGLFYTFLLRPILPWLALLFGHDVGQMPPIDTGELLALVTSMIGLGGFRSYEKSKGIK